MQLICFSKLAWRDALPLKREALCFASFCEILRRARYANPLSSQNIQLFVQGSWTQGKNKPEVSLWIWWALQPANSLDCSSTQLNIGDSSYSQQADVGANSKYRSRLWRKKDSKKLPTKRTSEPTQSTNWSGNISAAFQVARYKVDCAPTIFVDFEVYISAEGVQLYPTQRLCWWQQHLYDPWTLSRKSSLQNH